MIYGLQLAYFFSLTLITIMFHHHTREDWRRQSCALFGAVVSAYIAGIAKDKSSEFYKYILHAERIYNVTAEQGTGSAGNSASMNITIIAVQEYNYYCYTSTLCYSRDTDFVCVWSFVINGHIIAAVTTIEETDHVSWDGTVWVGEGGAFDRFSLAGG